MAQLTSFCGEDSSKWNAKKPAIDGEGEPVSHKRMFEREVM